jgi:hypothetical protein
VRRVRLCPMKSSGKPTLKYLLADATMLRTINEVLMEGGTSCVKEADFMEAAQRVLAEHEKFLISLGHD